MEGIALSALTLSTIDKHLWLCWQGWSWLHPGNSLHAYDERETCYLHLDITSRQTTESITYGNEGKAARIILLHRSKHSVSVWLVDALDRTFLLRGERCQWRAVVRCSVWTDLVQYTEHSEQQCGFNEHHHAAIRSHRSVEHLRDLVEYGILTGLQNESIDRSIDAENSPGWMFGNLGTSQTELLWVNLDRFSSIASLLSSISSIRWTFYIDERHRYVHEQWRSFDISLQHTYAHRRSPSNDETGFPRSVNWVSAWLTLIVMIVIVVVV